MRGKLRSTATIAAGLLVLVALMGAEGAPDVEAVKKQGREYTKLFYAADLQSIHEKFTDELKAAMSFDELQEIRRMVGLQLGEETELVSEDVEARDEYLVYTRRARFAKYAGEVESQWVLRAGGIAGLQFRPAESAGDSAQPED